MRFLWPILLALTVFPGATRPVAQSARPVQTFGGTVDLVQVDVSVLDKNRRPVRGLKASDFRLLVDGQPHPVAAFTAVNLPSLNASSKSAWMRDVPGDIATNDLAENGRLVVIVMDRSIPFGLPTISARGMAKAAIEQLGLGDLAAVVYTGSGTPQDFTSDRGRLLAAIGENPTAGLSGEAAAQWATLKDHAEAEGWSVVDAVRDIPKLLPNENSGECYCGICVLKSITTIADALRDAPGRQKSLLFIGADITTDTPDPRCHDAVIDARETLFQSLDLANLTVHAFDANGLQSNVIASSQGGGGGPLDGRPGLAPTKALPTAVGPSKEIIARQGRLAALPDYTGGRMVLNTNAPETRMPDVFRESSSYYLLGFKQPAADGREHTIRVQVDRPDVHVQARRAYTAPAATARANVDRVPAGIAGVIPKRSGIALTVNALAVTTPATHDPVVIIALHAEHETGRTPPTASPEPIDITTAIFTTDGRPVGMFHQAVAVAPAPSPDASLAYDILQRLPAKPGRYELRIAVTNTARGETGSVYAFIDIPAIGKATFAWSDVGLSARAARPATKDGVTDLVPVLPVARRNFDRQEHVTAFISGYHVSGPLPVPIEIVGRIIDATERKRFEQKTSISAADFDASQRVSYQLDLPVATLEAGPYLLTIETTAGKAKTTHDVRFNVR